MDIKSIEKEKLLEILDAVSEGMPEDLAFESVGLPRWLYFKWLEIYNEWEKTCTEPLHYSDDEEFTVLSFMNSIKKKNLSNIRYHVQNFRKQKPGTYWQASAWWLERRLPKSFAKIESIAASEASNKTAESNTIEVKFIDPNQPEIKRHLDELEKDIKEKLGE